VFPGSDLGIINYIYLFKNLPIILNPAVMTGYPNLDLMAQHTVSLRETAKYPSIDLQRNQGPSRSE
jgi:hypothetical protein